jgi:hypothetical protein
VKIVYGATFLKRGGFIAFSLPRKIRNECKIKIKKDSRNLKWCRVKPCFINTLIKMELERAPEVAPVARDDLLPA